MFFSLACAWYCFSFILASLKLEDIFEFVTCFLFCHCWLEKARLEKGLILLGWTITVEHVWGLIFLFLILPILSGLCSSHLHISIPLFSYLFWKDLLIVIFFISPSPSLYLVAVLHPLTICVFLIFCVFVC